MIDDVIAMALAGFTVYDIIGLFLKKSVFDHPAHLAGTFLGYFYYPIHVLIDCDGFMIVGLVVGSIQKVVDHTLQKNSILICFIVRKSYLLNKQM